MKSVMLINAILALTLLGITAFISKANEVSSNLSVIENSTAVESGFSLKQFSYTELLSVFDIDSDGSLSKEELSTSDNQEVKLAFKQLDLNKDESISADEFNAVDTDK